MHQLLVTANVPSSQILVTLMTEVLRSSNTLVLARATWSNIPENNILSMPLIISVADISQEYINSINTFLSGHKHYFRTFNFYPKDEANVSLKCWYPQHIIGLHHHETLVFYISAGTSLYQVFKIKTGKINCKNMSMSTILNKQFQRGFIHDPKENIWHQNPVCLPFCPIWIHIKDSVNWLRFKCLTEILKFLIMQRLPISVKLLYSNKEIRELRSIYWIQRYNMYTILSNINND
jgi:hypothetical protein